VGVTTAPRRPSATRSVGSHRRCLRGGLAQRASPPFLGPANVPVFPTNFHRASQFARWGDGGRWRRRERVATATMLSTRNTLYGLQMAPLVRAKGLKRIAAARSPSMSRRRRLSSNPRGTDACAQASDHCVGVFLFWNSSPWWRARRAALATRRRGARRAVPARFWVAVARLTNCIAIVPLFRWVRVADHPWLPRDYHHRECARSLRFWMARAMTRSACGSCWARQVLCASSSSCSLLHPRELARSSALAAHQRTGSDRLLSALVMAEGLVTRPTWSRSPSRRSHCGGGPADCSSALPGRGGRCRSDLTVVWHLH